MSDLLIVEHYSVPQSLLRDNSTSKGLTYSTVFTTLTSNRQDRCIPIGLYRPAGYRGSTKPYVSTNPPPNTIVVEGDLIFVLKRNKQRMSSFIVASDVHSFVNAGASDIGEEKANTI